MTPYKNKLHRSIKVDSITVTTVTVKCDRCKLTATGQCHYPNVEMFVTRELRYILIRTNRSTRSMYPQHKMVCPNCAVELENFFLSF